jgi:stearoyl-CoA desaturase (delta-9 desaturase)
VSILFPALIIGVVISQVAFFITTIYLHRALSHKALVLNRQIRFVFRVLTWMATGIRPRQWVAVHRKHHAYTDTKDDPHSPIVLGYWKVQLANAWLYRKVARNSATVDKYTKDLPRDRWDKYLFDHALLGLGVGIGILVLVFGWEVGLLAAYIHTVLYLLGGGAINAIGHKWGKRPFDNLATNNQWLAWLVAGEGLHNNHHAIATASKLSLNPGEIDPGWWVIKLLHSAKLISLREIKFTPVLSSSDYSSE